MRIYSKKAFAIGEGVTKADPTGKCIITVPGTFQTIPDELHSDPMLVAAMNEGSIVLVDSQEKQKVVESTETAGSVVTGGDGGNDEQAFYEELKTKTKDEAIAMAEDFGLKLTGDESAKKIKQMVMTAYREEANN